MSITISLFEHQSCAYSEIPSFPQEAGSRERILIEIERLNNAAGQEIIHLGRNKLSAQALVGILRVGEFTFEILPKIDWDPDEKSSLKREGALYRGRAVHPDAVRQKEVRQKAALSATGNLFTMLSYAFNIQIHEQEVTGLETQPGSWFELLTRLFVTGLYRQILSGLSHQYVSQEEVLPVLRGRWDVQRQILHNALARHAFHVVYDEFSPDIPLNQVFRFVIEQLHDLCQDPETLLLLGELQEWFNPVSHLPEITPAVLGGIRFTRLNERYQPAYNLARLFLSGSVIQLTTGGLPAYAFVFDMNELFERFVAAFLDRHHREILPEAWQNANIISQSDGLAYFLARSEGKNVIRLRPDLLFFQNGHPAPLLIADMKYKILKLARNSMNIDPGDIYQMLAYAVRFACPVGLLLYPQSAAENAIRKPFEIESTGIRLFVATLNLRIPLHQPQPLIQELRDILQRI